ncbi:MAG: hypothetical protein VW600_12055, partial [Ferrovibrio sp.]
MKMQGRGAGKLLFAAALPVMLGGCGAFYDGQSRLLDPESGERPATMAGTTQAIPPSELRKVDLDDLVLENSVVPSIKSCESKTALQDSIGKELTDEQRINTVMRRFYQCTKSLTPSATDSDTAEARRNRIQSQIMTVARRRCEIYKQMLSNVESQSGFYLGSIATISGVLGSLFTATNTARAFSASAGLSSGLEAEFTRAFFKDTAIPVILTGIDMKRLEIQGEIDAKRKKTVVDYNLEDAIGDSIRYNGACSTVEGLKHVKDALSKPVGIAQAQQVMRQVDLARQELAVSSLPVEDRAARYQLLARNEQARAALYEQLGETVGSERA